MGALLWVPPISLVVYSWAQTFRNLNYTHRLPQLSKFDSSALFLFFSFFFFLFGFSTFFFLLLKSACGGFAPLLFSTDSGLSLNYQGVDFSMLLYSDFFFFFYENLFLFNVDGVSFFFIGMVLCAYPLSFLVFDHRINFKNSRFSYYYLYLFSVLVLFFFVQNLIVMVLLYEMILVPTFLLMYNLGSSRQCIEGSIFFFIWAHFGSAFIFLGIIYISLRTGSLSYRTVSGYTFSSYESFFLFWAFFVGFGCKIPLWPFYYWLPKAHVEAPTGLSVFLSGVLVKIAFFGFFKCSALLGSSIPTVAASTLPILGVIDGSVKMFYQTDLKKIIAYATVVHMNYILYTSLLGFCSLLKGGIFLLCNHCFSATALFFSADLLYRRHQTRLSYEISGVFHYCPWLVTLIAFGLLVNFNFPLTLGFIGEVNAGCSSFFCWPLTTLIIHFFLFFVSVVNFIKPWLDIFFGYPYISDKSTNVDVSRKEFFFLLLPIAYSFILGVCPSIFYVLMDDYTDVIFFA